MTHFFAHRRVPARWLVLGAALSGAVALSGPAHAGIYVDNTLGEVAPADVVHVAHPRPVQLLFEFDMAGRVNARATKAATPIITDELRKLGTVGQVSDTPVPDGARLIITVDDVADKNAAGKGAAVGLTFGLAGAVVADNYTFVIRYTPVRGAPAIERTVHHRIYAKIGLGASPPANATKASNGMAAFTTVVHQALAHGLNEIAADPGFAPAVPASAPAPTSADATASAAGTPAAPAPASAAGASIAPAPRP